MEQSDSQHNYELSLSSSLLNIAFQHYQAAQCMTERIDGLQAVLSVPISSLDIQQRIDGCLQNFYELGKNDKLVLNKWFAIQVNRRCTLPVGYSVIL